MTYPVEIELDGMTYVGSYTIEKKKRVRTLTVSTMVGSRSTPVGTAQGIATAQALLAEIIRHSLEQKRGVRNVSGRG